MNYSEMSVSTKRETEDINQCGMRKSEIDQIPDFEPISHRRKSFSIGKLFRRKTKE